MRILAVDQARHGAWAVYDYEKRELLEYGTWAFESRDFTFERATARIEALLDEVIGTRGIDAVFLEDIQLRRNVQSFKRLAQLQGVLVNLCEKTNILYDLVAPTRWQSFCGARGRTAKEISADVTSVAPAGKRGSKILSLQFVRDMFGMETADDNLSDAVCLGWYVVNKVKIENGEIAEE